MSVVGADGLPPTSRAGNVLRPRTALKLSIRIPPTADPALALAALREALTTDVPYGARASFDEADWRGGVERAGDCAVARGGDGRSIRGGVRATGTIVR